METLHEDNIYEILKHLSFEGAITWYEMPEFNKIIVDNLDLISDIHCLPYSENFEELIDFHNMQHQELFNYAILDKDARVIDCLNEKYGQQLSDPLKFHEWIQYAKEKELLLKWSDVPKLMNTNPAVVMSLEQGYTAIGLDKGLYDPEEAFFDHVEVLTNNKIKHFYEYNNLAVTGSGADKAMIYDNLAKMPLVKIDQDFDYRI